VDEPLSSHLGIALWKRSLSKSIKARSNYHNEYIFVTSPRSASTNNVRFKFTEIITPSISMPLRLSYALYFCCCVCRDSFWLLIWTLNSIGSLCSIRPPLRLSFSLPVLPQLIAHDFWQLRRQSTRFLATTRSAIRERVGPKRLDHTSVGKYSAQGRILPGQKLIIGFSVIFLSQYCHWQRLAQHDVSVL
jgi:hypothetical protein